MKRITRTLLSAGLLALSAAGAAQNHVWKYVDAGDATTYAIRDDGTLWSCGWNEKGQLGVPGVAERTAEWQMVGQDADWKKAVGGKAYAFFIKADGSLWAVGTQENGVQGTGDGVDHRQPVRVGTDSDWADVAASRFWGYSAIGLKTDGSIWGWGSNSSSQLGLDGAGARVTPERIGTDNDWKMVTMGVSHTMAIKADGSLWGWGQNYNGQLGTGDTESRPKPERIGADNDWAYVKAIDNRTYAVKADGSLWATGDNHSNLLGMALAGGEYEPAYSVLTRVTTLDGPVAQVSGCEQTTTFAIGEGGTVTRVYALGSNANGGLGDGKGKLLSGSSSDMPFSLVPVKPLLPGGIVCSVLSSGQNYSMVVTADGKMYGWGNNRGGQLGDGTEYDRLQLSYYKSPIEIPCPGGATPGGGSQTEITVDAAAIPSNLRDAEVVRLTGTWNTAAFGELAVALGTSGFMATNKALRRIDMSQAAIEPGTDLYVQGSLSKNGAFVNCKALEAVVMPEGGGAANFANCSSAFMNCEKLATIDLSGCTGLTSLKSAFSGCASLRLADLSAVTALTGMSSMQGAFSGCASLCKVVLPAEVTFSSGTFADCTSLSDIDWTRYAGTAAPVFYVGMFSGIADLKAVTLTVSGDAYPLFAADANWSRLTLKAATADGVDAAGSDAALSFDGTTLRTSSTIGNVGVYTLAGALVAGRHTVSGSWSLASLPAGAYVLVYTDGARKQSVRIVRR